jgi:hypothetical protein
LPFAVFPDLEKPLVGLDVVKTQLVPIDAFVTHDTLYLWSTAWSKAGLSVFFWMGATILHYWPVWEQVGGPFSMCVG